MCLSPLKLKDGTNVACRGCELCRSNRLNDLIGRCIAEQCTASKTLAVTLTYAGDTAESAVLRYADVQLFLKRLRKDGYSVRYICAGEYGDKKGRAHWHIILFFYGRSPDIQIDRRVDWSFWPHGFVYFQNPDYRGFAYVMKYALKQEFAVKALSMSKKPPLGYSFFMKLAHDIVDRALPVHSPEYSFAHVLDRNGVPRRYWLQGRMREMWLEEYCRYWQEVFGGEPPPSDFLLEKYLDPIARKEMELDPIRFERDKAMRDDLYLQHLRNRERADRAAFRHPVAFLMLSSGQSDILVAFSDFTAELEMGSDKWMIENDGVSVERQLLLSDLPLSKHKPVLAWLDKCRRIALSGR